MPTELEAPPSAPTADQIEQQLSELGKDRLMQGGLRRLALRFLIDFKLSGRYEQSPRPISKAIYAEFYEFAVKKTGGIAPKDTEASGKKLFGELIDALKDYYAGPGKEDALIITLQGGMGGGYEPRFKWNAGLSAHKSAPNADVTAPDYGVIANTDFMRDIEDKVPQGTTDIWIAASDLSNVGDETSAYSDYVRKVVRSNALRNVDYTYICPQGHAGESRIQNLRDCFNDTPGKLHLHQIPLERFLEISVVLTHFISLNPLAEKPDAYMQLPSLDAHRAWIRLNHKDSARVVAKMKSLINSFPEDDA
ncbi:hypothetical protein [Acidicapsa acidisoli]|uniref:hypothetical protein n=1 Tax=Acidicapsa acidisoli TaxID=1615681 RepID=UPI0021DF41C7|nr:hypothetical protein [Acidicapsa acidisoli]